MIKSLGESKSLTTSDAAAHEVQYDMTLQRQYQVTAKGAAMWVRIVAKGEASAVAAVGGDSSHFVPQNASLPVAAIAGKQRISVIRDGATDITCVLSELPNVVSV